MTSLDRHPAYLPTSHGRYALLTSIGMPVRALMIFAVS